MEHRGRGAGPRARASQSGLLDLPDEVLLLVLRRVEAAYVASGQTSAEFLQLRAVCKKLRQSVDASVTNLSRGIAPRFCRWEPLDKVEAKLRRQLARWPGRLRRVELHIHGSNRALTQLIPALGQSCPGLTELWVWKAVLDHHGVKRCLSMAHLTALTSLETLTLTGFAGLSGTLPPLPSLQRLEADFERLTCGSPLPSLEELVLGYGHRPELENPYRETSLPTITMPHLHASPHLRHISLMSVEVVQLTLPRSLRTIHLFNIELNGRMDWSTELPELTELLFDLPNSFPYSLEGGQLSPWVDSLLAGGNLQRLKLQLWPYFPALERLPLNTGLTSLTLHFLNLQELPHLGEALVALESLTELDLSNLKGLDVLDISHLKLQQLKLESLPNLSSIVGLGLETQVASRSRERLPLVTRLSDLGRNLTGLTVLELKNLRLENWRADNCSRLPGLKALCLSELVQPSYLPGVEYVSAPVQAFWLDLGGWTRLTEITLSNFGVSSLDLASLPLLESLQLQDCGRLAHFVCGSMSLMHLHLENLPRLDVRFFDFTGGKWGGSLCMQPNGALLSLKSLTLRYLPALSSLTLGEMKALESVEIRACFSLKEVQLVKLSSLTSLSLQEPASGSSDEATPSRIGPFPPLRVMCIERLLIRDMPKLQSIFCPPTLWSLSIEACHGLTSLPLEHMPHLGSLRLLDVAQEVMPAWFRQAQNLRYVELGQAPLE